MRKYYLDNLRTIAILMLFPYHVFMIYNKWAYYLHSKDLLISEIFIKINAFWMMPMLFTVAGMSSRYSFNNRSTGEYVKERLSKLLTPLIFGLLLIVPIQSYIADLHFNGQANYLNYFTKLTDFMGNDGAFTPGQLWFILFLFVISIISLPIMIWYNKKGKGTIGDKIPLWGVLLMGLLPCIGNMLVDISGKSPTEFLAYFLLGFFFISSDKMLKTLDKHRFLLLVIFMAGVTLTAIFNHVCYEAVRWFSVLAILGIARHYLDFKGNISTYLSDSSFAVYIFHQSWIIIIGYFVLKFTDIVLFQIPLILISSIILTYLTYEFAKRFAVFRFMFGFK